MYEERTLQRQSLVACVHEVSKLSVEVLSVTVLGLVNESPFVSGYPWDSESYNSPQDKFTSCLPKGTEKKRTQRFSLSYSFPSTQLLWLLNIQIRTNDWTHTQKKSYQWKKLKTNREVRAKSPNAREEGEIVWDRILGERSWSRRGNQTRAILLQCT